MDSKKSNEIRDEIIRLLEENPGMKSLYPLLHYFEGMLKKASRNSPSVTEQKEDKFCSGTFYCSLNSTYNSDGTCAECGKKKREAEQKETQEELIQELVTLAMDGQHNAKALAGKFAITRK